LAGPEEGGVDLLRAWGFQGGDDVADVETRRGGLDAGDDAAFLLQGPGGVAGLGEAAHGGRAGLGALDPDGVGVSGGVRGVRKSGG